MGTEAANNGRLKNSLDPNRIQSNGDCSETKSTGALRLIKDRSKERQEKSDKALERVPTALR
ncbi:hypothetical protein RUM43_007164 [Polyplax serrata]|uniref:Uncharacterized protein n=1 Tax=Polyplax serrata TaxID=468196 RepID=A0AAN8P5D9_POLSC